MHKTVKPNKLNFGDKIAIVSLSSGILGESFCQHQLQLGIRRLKDLNLETVFMKNSLKGFDTLKQDPKLRADDLIEAFKRKDIAGILCAIGGDDTYALMPYLLDDNNFKNVVKNNPKIFLGYSDSTNNHFLLNKLGLNTFYGLAFLTDIAELDGSMLDYSKASVKNLFINLSNYLIKPAKFWFEERTDFSINSLNTPRIMHKETKNYEVLRGSGIIKGKLFGGCLESICSMLTGDRYPEQKYFYEKYNIFPPTSFWKNKIMFLETSEGKPSLDFFAYYIDILINKKILQNVKALVIGKPQNEVNYEKYNKILFEKTKKFNLPIITNINFGHAYPKAIIPYNLKASINFDTKEFKIEESFFKNS